MNEVHVADIAFRIERPLHDERAHMRPTRQYSARSTERKLQIERREPAAARPDRASLQPSPAIVLKR